MDYKFAIVNHSTLHLSKFTTKDELLDAVVVLKKQDVEFSAFRYYTNINKWVAFDKWE